MVTTATASPPTSLMDEDIRQLEDEIAELERELTDLDQGIYHMRLDNGLILEVGVTGDELQLDDTALRAALGLDRLAADAQPTAPAPIRRYLPYALLGGGALLLLLVAIIGVRLFVAKPAKPASATAVVSATPTLPPTKTPTPTITPTPSPTPSPTPPLIPIGFIGRAPAEIQFPALKFQQPVYKGDWTVDQGQVTLDDGGSQARYYDSFVGEGNTVIGGDATGPESPLYPLRSADINDVLVITDRANRKFHFRLLPFGEDRVERYITPQEIWVIRPTDRPALTVVLRVEDGRRLVLRGALVKTELGK